VNAEPEAQEQLPGTPEEAIRQACQTADTAVEAFYDLRQRIFDQLFPNNDGNLYNHAVREMELAGLDKEDADYDGDIYKHVLQLIRVFVCQGHSGGSAQLTSDLFCKLARYETLTPNDHSMNKDVSDHVDKAPGSLLQDVRDSRWFSEDGGKTWYSVDDEGLKVGTANYRTSSTVKERQHMSTDPNAEPEEEDEDNAAEEPAEPVAATPEGSAGATGQNPEPSGEKTPPGQEGSRGQGVPGQSGAPPRVEQPVSGPPGQTGTHPQGGPPGQQNQPQNPNQPQVNPLDEGGQAASEQKE
jgi:hypothetical protein